LTNGAAPVLPRYFSGSIAEVLPSAVAALGADEFTNAIGLPAQRAYVVLLVDGLGWNLLREHAADAPYLSSLVPGAEPITCGIPSTTATSLTSLGTGLPPGAHGVVGFTSRIPGTNRLLDALQWDKRVDPTDWQVYDTVFGRAQDAGVTATAVIKRVFAGSGLTMAGQRGATFVTADTEGERIAAAVQCAARTRSLTYLYAGDLDATGHRRGCGSAAWRHQLAITDNFIQRLRQELPRTAGLLVTADHGMVDIPLEQRLEVDDLPDLLDGVSVFAGEARLRHLYCDPDRAEELATRWREHCGPRAWVVTRDQAVDEGWFGSVDTHVRPRLGDVIVASGSDLAVVSRSRFPHEASLLGLHGSLTADEMLVPLLLDAV
jgi:predicted AlkP superfamily pyrophosphatase or phosphodiesterase